MDDVTALALDQVFNEIPLGLVEMLDAPVADAVRTRPGAPACETTRRRCGQRTLFAYDWDHVDGPPPGRMPNGGAAARWHGVSDGADGRGGEPRRWRVTDLYRPHTEWVSAVSGRPLPASGYDPTDV